MANDREKNVKKEYDMEHMKFKTIRSSHGYKRMARRQNTYTVEFTINVLHYTLTFDNSSHAFIYYWCRYTGRLFDISNEPTDMF